MSARLRRELAAGLVLAVLAVAGAYWQAERTAAFERRGRTRARRCGSSARSTESEPYALVGAPTLTLLSPRTNLPRSGRP